LEADGVSLLSSRQIGSDSFGRTATVSGEVARQGWWSILEDVMQTTICHPRRLPRLGSEVTGAEAEGGWNSGCCSAEA
jgi:hypothetical protein